MKPAIQPVAEMRNDFAGARLIPANEDRFIAADVHYNELKRAGVLEARNQRAAEELQRKAGVL